MFIKYPGALLALFFFINCYAIEPLTDDVMSQINGQVSPLSAVMLVGLVPALPVNVRQQVSAGNLGERPAGINNQSSPVREVSSVQALNGLGLNVGGDGGVSLDLSGAPVDTKSMELSVSEAAESGLGAISGIFDISMSSIKLSGISDQSRVSIQTTPEGAISTSVHGVVENVTIDQMSFGDKSLFQGYQMQNVQFQNMNTTIRIKE